MADQPLTSDEVEAVAKADAEQYPLTRDAEDAAWGAWSGEVPPAAIVAAHAAGLPVFERAKPERFEGTRWRRRDKRGDAADEVEFVAFQPVDEYGYIEVIVRTVDFAGIEVRRINANGEVVTSRVNTLALDPEDFIEQYTRVDAALEAAEAVLARLERAMANVRIPG